jgi:thymidylate synthase
MQLSNQTPYSAWRSALKHIVNKGETYIDGDDRRCSEVLNLQIRIEKPTPENIEEPYNVLKQDADFFYPSKRHLLDVIFNTEPKTSLDYTYGTRMRYYNDTLDQVKDYVIPLLQRKQGSRKAIIQVYDPAQDSSHLRGATPGIIYIHILIRDQKVHLTAMIRSNDIFLGYPANIIQLHSIQKAIANQLEKPTGSLTTISNSAHIFHDAFSDLTTITGIHDA